MKSFTVVDLNDANIRVARDEQVLVRSPGYAVIKDDKIALGSQAARLTRLYPRSSHNDFWYRLGQEAIQSMSKQIRHNADLAYMQLAEINEQAGKPASCLFAVPASFNPEQLGLLLGLLKAANFQEVRLVDSALLASIKALHKGELQHLDMQLHQTVLTRLVTDDKHQVVATDISPEVGILNIHEQCAKLISDEFINQSRFDPHHNAETEQLLFEKVPACLRTLTSASMSKINIEYQAQSYSANITREAILRQITPLYEAVYKHIKHTTPLLLSHRFADLPGFSEGLNNACILDEFAIFAVAKDYTAYFSDIDPNTNYLSELPILNVAERPTSQVNINASTPDITHILIENIAHRLDGPCFYFSAVHQLETTLSTNSEYSIRLQNGHYFIQAENNAQIVVNETILKDTMLLSLGDKIKTSAAKTASILIKVR